MLPHALLVLSLIWLVHDTLQRFGKLFELAYEPGRLDFRFDFNAGCMKLLSIQFRILNYCLLKEWYNVN